MLFKFKILESEKESKFLGMFGDCIKIRLNEVLLQNSKHSLATQNFLAHELGISSDLVEIKEFNSNKNMLLVELPDPAYEIIMSWVENK